MEAQQADAAREEQALLAQLQAGREEKLVAAVATKQREAAEMWESMAPLVEAGGPEAKQAVEIFLKGYGSAKVWVEDPTGRYERAVRSPEVAKAQAWLGSYLWDEGDTSGGSADLDWVHIRGFNLEVTRSEVTFAQYRACVNAGACTAPHTADGTCQVKRGGDWSEGTLPAEFLGSNQPVVCVDLEQATAFAD